MEYNHKGWWAVRHRDGWWVGTEQGVPCYEERLWAQYALTIIWQRDGGKGVNFRVALFTGANVVTGEYTPIKSAEQALADYERQKGASPPGDTQNDTHGEGN